MKNQFFLLIFFLFSFKIIYAQNSEQKFIYEIVNQVIKNENLNKNFGLIKKPFKENSENNDELILQKYLIKESNSNQESENLITEISFPNKNVLTKNDVSEMLRFKEKNRKLKWKNKFLKFNQKNTENRYQFSIPFVNKDNSKIIIQYELLCSELCGNGKTLFLTKENQNWKITTFEIWMH
jgi:hypothetical protein